MRAQHVEGGGRQRLQASGLLTGGLSADTSRVSGSGWPLRIATARPDGVAKWRWTCAGSVRMPFRRQVR